MTIPQNVISLETAPDSCLFDYRVENPELWWNPDSVLVDTCVNSPTYQMFYRRIGWIVYSPVLLFPNEPIPYNEHFKWEQIDTVHSQYRNSFKNMEEEFGKYSLYRYFPKDKDHMKFPRYLIDFEKYQIENEVFHFIINIDPGLFGVATLNQYGVISVEDPITSGENLYPNPARDVITVKLPNDAIITRYSIYNNLGSVVLSAEGTWSGDMTLEISQLAPGVYTLVINDTIYRFIKME